MFGFSCKREEDMDSFDPVATLYALFSGSELSFATFDPSERDPESGKLGGKYTTHERAAGLKDIENHLEGKLGAVIVPLHQDGTCSFGVIDVDPKNYTNAADSILELRNRIFLEKKYPLHYFQSKSGGAHFVLFLDQPRPAPVVRGLLHRYIDELGLKAEVFPKQDQMPESGKASCVNLPYFKDPDGFKAWWSNYRQTSTAEIEAELAKQPALEVRPHIRSLPKIVKNISFRAELERVGLEYVARETEYGTQYCYHGLVNKTGKIQGCLLKGDVHHQKTNVRQSQFVETKNGEIFHRCFADECRNIEENKTRLALKSLGLEGRILGVTDGSDWREFVQTFGQLSSELPRFLVDGLIPEKAFTMVVASAFNGKTFFALQCALAIARGEPIWGFDGPSEPRPVIYHVPEMNANSVRRYAALLGYTDNDQVFFRTMESEKWEINSARMLCSANNAVVVLDTVGYFNPAKDTHAYEQSIEFATLIYNLLNQGALGVIGLYHVPKSNKDTGWTLENSVLGSTGYGGILRSCLRLKNLNVDLNDDDIHLYVQGMKNPGLKPFQLEGVPLQMRVPPGESPYLNQIAVSGKENKKYTQACQLFRENPEMKHSEIAKLVQVSPTTISHYFKKYKGQEELNLSDENL